MVDLPRPAQRLAWLAENLGPTGSLHGSGIVYTLTKRDADQVATFLNAHGISALAYSGDQDTADRVAAEDRLLANEVKAICATSALGMGYDKSDLTFVVHYQAPGSVVAYYQQVGRAGRGVDHADVVLLRGVEDRRIQDFFIEQSFPSRERVTAVLEDLRAAGDGGRSTQELLGVVNIGRGRLEAMLKILDVEGALRRDGSRWVSAEDSDWSYDGERYARVTALRREEQRAMERFGADGRCLMRVLQEELDDPEPARTAGAARSAPPRASPRRRTPRWWSWPAVTCARRRSSSRSRRWRPTRRGRCARSPRTCASSPAGRWPASATAAGGRRCSAACAATASRTMSWPRWPTRCARARARWPGSRRFRRSGSASVLERLAAQVAAALGVPALSLRGRAREAAPAAGRDGQRRAAGGQRPRRLSRGRHAPARGRRAAR